MLNKGGDFQFKADTASSEIGLMLITGSGAVKTHTTLFSLCLPELMN